LATVNGNIAGYGCSSSEVKVYQCRRFNNEPVLKQAASRCLDKIKAKVPGYTGRTCRECEVPREPVKSQPKNDRFDTDKHFSALPYHPIVGNIAAVSCHYNPQRSQSRIRCYEQFARQFPRIGLVMFAAEGSLDDRWEIPGAWRYDIDPEACLFAKENLINLAIARLPDRFDHVVWIDSDVLMLNHDYVDRLSQSLEKSPVVQAFQELRYISRDGGWQTDWRSSIGYINAKNKTSVAEPKEGYPGLAWAARRELLANIGGIYDRVITGGGDVAWCCGMWGDLRPNYTKQWSQALVADVRRWAAAAKPQITGVGYVQARGVHLYHGTLKHRQYSRRNEILGEVGYDPQLHLEYAENGTLRWSAAAPKSLRDGVREYMLGRKEDE